MRTTSDALVDVAEHILAQIGGLSTTEISKRGRKYRFVNNNFQRVREEDKHLVVHPERPQDHVATVLAYGILSHLLPDIFTSYKDLCLIIVGVAAALEQNHWYEEENSSVVHLDSQNGTVDLSQKQEALDFADSVTPEHLSKGYNLLYCSKLNFLHTDHHVGSKLEGHYLREYVSEYFGEDALELPVVLLALKSFSHWGHIKGLLYKLGVPSMDVDDAFEERFSEFPDPPAELAHHVYDRFPSGTSKYSLVCRTFDQIAQYKYSRLIPYPAGDQFDPRWVYDLNEDIAQNPAKYHLRARAKRLSADPANLQELSQKWKASLEHLFLAVSLILNIFPGIGNESLLQNSKIPEYTEELAAKYLDYHEELLSVARDIEDYESKEWVVDDIILRMHKGHVNNFHDEIERVRYQ